MSTFVCLEDLSQVAVGFANGSVAIIRGDLINDRGARQRIVFESQEPITGLDVQHGHTITTLFIATTNRILTLTIVGRGQGQAARVLEDAGCAVGCMVLDKETGDILIAREDAIHTYGLRGRGPSFAYDSPKNSLNLFKGYVALVCPPKTAASKSDTLGNFSVGQADDIFNTTTFTFLDTDLNFIAHSEALISPPKNVFTIWGDLFLIASDGTVKQSVLFEEALTNAGFQITRYHEKNLQKKLEILYQRNLYILAINLAQKAGIDTLQQNVIFRKYGDFLYQKGDYDTAMQQYLRAIDNTEPSQVIRKVRIYSLFIDYYSNV